jgi:hypothetical protein
MWYLVDGYQYNLVLNYYEIIIWLFIYLWYYQVSAQSDYLYKKIN